MNVDDTGLITVQGKPSRIIAKRGEKQVVTITSEERGTLVTAVLCMSAEGRYVPPMLIIPCVCSKPEFSDGTVTVFHLSGWTQREIFT